MNTATDARQKRGEDFQVDPVTAMLGRWLWRTDSRPVKLGRMESRWYAEDLQRIKISKPVFIAGLARSGTTILLEFLASLPGVATHRYRDFPFVHAPIWWNRFLDKSPRRQMEPVERSHRDGIQITPESPEAMEEPLWISFFPRAHETATYQVLNAEMSNPDFETFFPDHLRKILFVRNGQRYVSKGNYNITRLEYLQRLFPDAHFILPVREPVAHVASLIKQHRLFTENLKDNPDAREHLRKVGHSEFGPDRCAINAGNTALALEVESLWRKGEEVRGWAMYWASIHGFIAERLAANPPLKSASLIVRYEDLCENPEAMLDRIVRHCSLEKEATDRIPAFANTIHAPRYYEPTFSVFETDLIRRETAGAAALIPPTNPTHTHV